MSAQTVARRYASALVDVATEHGESREVQNELLSWEAMINDNPMLQEAFGNPTIPADQKRKVVDELISRTKVRKTTANFLQVLLRNQRLTELSAINQRIAQLLDEHAGVVAAEVITARPFPEPAKEALVNRLAGMTGKNVRLRFKTDDAIIGGLITQIGSTVYDGSIRTQLDLLAKKMVAS